MLAFGGEADYSVRAKQEGDDAVERRRGKHAKDRKEDALDRRLACKEDATQYHGAGRPITLTHVNVAGSQSNSKYCRGAPTRLQIPKHLVAIPIFVTIASAGILHRFMLVAR